MPFYDIAAGTRDYNPIGAYYQGKALRADTALREKQVEGYDDAAALEERKVEVDEENTEIRRLEYQQKVLEGLENESEKGREALLRGALAANDVYENDGDAEAATRAFMYGYGQGAEDIVGDQQIPPDFARAVVAGADKLKGEKSEDQRERKIQAALRANPEMSREEIEHRLDWVDYMVDPSGRNVYEIDKLGGGVSEANIQRDVDPVEKPVIPERDTLWAKAEAATGPAATIKGEGSKYTGALGGPISEEVTEARQTFKAAENTVIRAFSLNPRYPVAEQKRIKENIDIGPKFWDSKRLMHSRMRSVDAFLQQEAAQLEYGLAQPGVTKKQEDADEQTLRAITRFLDSLGVPHYPQVNTQEDLDALPSGTTYLRHDGKLGVRE